VEHYFVIATITTSLDHALSQEWNVGGAAPDPEIWPGKYHPRDFMRFIPVFEEVAEGTGEELFDSDFFNTASLGG
jgi:hypothetical protein